MMRRNIKKYRTKKQTMTAWITAAALLGMPLCVYATNQDIQSSKDKIEENKEKLESVQSEKYAVEEKLKELEALKSDAAAYIEKLDRELSDLAAAIKKLEADMTVKEAEIAVTREELAVAKADEEEQYSSMKLRIKYMYEKGDMSYLDMLFEARSFSELLNKAEYIQRVSEYDREKLQEYVAIKEDIAAKEARLQQEYAELDALKASTEDKKNGVETLQQDKQKELAGYNAKIKEAGAEVAKMREEIAGIQAAIQAEENNIAAIEAEMRRKEEEARKKAEASGETYETKSLGNISFTWPLPGQSRITSRFGDRESPTEGASSNHKGIDVGAPTGTKIIAAADGTVVIATYSASAGNYVMINHGGGVYTVYMHMNSIAVSVGDEVSRGDKVGEVGSTGYSTGPHLHFGIRNNGSYINPLSYVSP